MSCTRIPGITVNAAGQRIMDKEHRGIRIYARLGTVSEEDARQRLIALVWPDWVRFYWLIRVLVDLGNLIVAFFLLIKGDPIVVAHLGKAPNAAHVEQIVNQTIHYCIWFAVAMVVLQLVKDVRRLVSVQPVATPARST